jgi:hypothetical protein
MSRNFFAPVLSAHFKTERAVNPLEILNLCAVIPFAPEALCFAFAAISFFLQSFNNHKGYRFTQRATLSYFHVVSLFCAYTWGAV